MLSTTRPDHSSVEAVVGIKPSHRVALAVAVLTIFLAAIGAFANAGAFARYMADDFCTAYELNRIGFVASQVKWYTGWTGRFAFTAAVNLVELFGPGVAPILPPMALVLWFGLLTWTILQFSLLFINKRHLLASLLLAGVFLYVFLESVPIIGQVLYWQTGMLTYLAPLIGATLVFGILARLAQPKQSLPRRTMIGWSIAIGLITFVSGGFSDTFAALQVSFLTLATLSSYLLLPKPRRRNVFIPLLAALAGAVLALVIVAAAPGNAHRETYFPSHPGISEVIRVSTIRAAGIIYYWTTEHTISVLIILIFPLLIAATLHRMQHADGLQLDDAAATRLLLAIPAVAFSLCIACFAPVTWGWGIAMRPPERMLAIPIFVLICTAIAWGSLVGLIVAQAMPIPFPVRRSMIVIGAATLFSLLLVGPVRTAVVIHSTVPLMKQYAEKWDLRDQQLRAAADTGHMNAEVEWMDNVVGLKEIQPEPDEDTNLCVASYYGLQSVRAR